jgi:outer membrane protein TolC
MSDRILEAAKATAELANEQYRSGTLSRLDQARRQLAYAGIHKEAVAARQAAMAAREALNRTLRLSREQTDWALPERLPDLPAERPTVAEVESLALRNRPEALGAGIEDSSAPLGARIAAEARDAYARMLTAYDTARFQRDQVLPVAQVVLEETQLHYNAMLEDVYALIEAAEVTIDAHKDYVEDLAAFWIAHAALSDAVGGQLPSSRSPTLAAAGSAAATR